MPQAPSSLLDAKSGPANPLPPECLYRRADLSGLEFATTAELSPLGGEAVQKRVLDAVKLGAGIDRAGFNLFVIGQRQSRMREAIKATISASLTERKPPPDWVYVNNFSTPDKPVAIEMPPGTAPDFHDAMHELVDDLKGALPAAFESEDYNTRRAVIDENARKAQADEFSALRDKAAAKSIIVLRTPLGFALAPAAGGSVVPPDEFSSWPEEKRAETRSNIALLEKDLERVVRLVPQFEKEHREAIRKLNRETAEIAVGHMIEFDKGALFGSAPKSSPISKPCAVTSCRTSPCSSRRTTMWKFRNHPSRTAPSSATRSTSLSHRTRSQTKRRSSKRFIRL